MYTLFVFYYALFSTNEVDLLLHEDAHAEETFLEKNASVRRAITFFRGLPANNIYLGDPLTNMVCINAHPGCSVSPKECAFKNCDP
jgi:hypothetical protein